MGEPDRSPLRDSSDAGIAAALDALGEAEWAKLRGLVDQLAESGDDHRFVAESWTDENGVHHLSDPHHEYPDALWAVIDFFYEHTLIIDFDWPHWDRFGPDPMHDTCATMAAVGTASVQDAMRLATGLARAERFIDGVLGEAMTSGLLNAVLWRILEWHGGA